ncbi:MAG: hypothetical protein ACOC38_08010 [Promethearchaeia archaeon]
MDVIEKIHEYASIWTFFGFLVAALAVLVVMGFFYQSRIVAITGGLRILDMRPWYSFEDAVQLFTLLGQDGRTLYTQHQILDAIFPILFGTTLSQGIARMNSLRDEQDIRWRQLALLPYLETFFDYLENFLIGTQIISFPVLSPFVIISACVATIMKWSLLILSGVILVGLAAKYVLSG